MKRAHLTVDSQPGLSHTIYLTTDGIAFVMSPPGVGADELIIRCDSDGEIWISIRPAGQGAAY